MAAGAALLAFCGALAASDAERANPAANITTSGDAIWWPVGTMTSVGYGDRYPTTGPVASPPPGSWWPESPC